MKPFMRAQLERNVQRLSELDFLLSREDIMKDMTQFLALSREHAEVAALVTPYQRWLQLTNDSESAHTMLQDSDPDLQAMAQEEIAIAAVQTEALLAQLQRMLLPKDPDDARNAFLEIRAGTGGDESTLFAGDLLRMYTRFCTERGWRVEVVSESPSELGGYKEVVVRIEGNGVYGCLKFESGGHRVQRVPV
ncbi:MAG: hypothetical protein RLZZ566_2222, partial [Pseudomonadota bacterium]